MKSLVISLLITTALFQSTPKINQDDGITVFGSVGKGVRIEGFVDLLCPGCQDHYLKIQQALNSFTPDQLSMTYHLIALPYHIYSFKLTAGYFFIRQNYGTQAATDYLTAIYTNQNMFEIDQTDRFSPSDNDLRFTASIASWLQKYQISSSGFFYALQAGSQYDYQARASHIFATYKGVAGTPTFWVYGIQDENIGNASTVDDLVTYFKTLVQAHQEQEKQNDQY